ncbi:MAG: Stp1/IreP family PP2C-type Ser/Thr phosphatase [Eubacteriales bacterium]
MLFYGKTDVGKRRDANQDNFIIRKYSDDVLAAVVCDGMGGANGGDVASMIAVDTFMAEVDKYESTHPSFFGDSEEEILDCLSAAVTAANRAVYKAASTDPSLAGMGTTLVACIISGENGYIVNVGDSRLYLISGDQIVQVTHDHSWVQAFIDAGKLSPEDAKKSRMKNAITRAVGTAKTVDVDWFVREMKPGTYAVLCSDGLTNHVEPDEIRGIVKNIDRNGDIESACASLIECANSRGGFDNITAVILSI